MKQNFFKKFSYIFFYIYRKERKKIIILYLTAVGLPIFIISTMPLSLDSIILIYTILVCINAIVNISSSIIKKHISTNYKWKLSLLIFIIPGFILLLYITQKIYFFYMQEQIPNIINPVIILLISSFSIGIIFILLGMHILFCKNKSGFFKKNGYFISKNVITSIILTMYISLFLFETINLLAKIISEKIIQSIHTCFINSLPSIYTTMIVSFLVLYATILTISTNLTSLFPYDISIKYIIFSKTSLLYPLTIVINFIISFFRKDDSYYYSFLLIEIFLLIIYTVSFVFLFLKKFSIEKYFDYFLYPVTSKFLSFKEMWEKHIEDSFIIKTDNEDSITIKTRNYDSKKFDTHELLIPASNGILSIDWNFIPELIRSKGLENLEFKFEINKFFLDKFENFKFIKGYFITEKKDIFQVKRRIILLLIKYVKYINVNLRDFEEIYHKLKKANLEDTLIDLLKKYIKNHTKDIYEKKFFINLFEKYIYKKDNIDEIGNPLEYKFSKSIKTLFEKRSEFMESPDVLAEIQSEYIEILKKAFKYKAKEIIKNADLTIKKLFPNDYIQRFSNCASKDNIKWFDEYQILINRTFINYFTLFELIIGSSFEDSFKKNVLIKYINTYVNSPEINLSKLPLEFDIKEKIDDIISDSKENIEINLIKLIFLIIYKISKKELDKSLFDIALDIFQLELINDSFENIFNYASTSYTLIEDYIDKIICQEREKKMKEKVIKEMEMGEITKSNHNLIKYFLILLFKNYINPSKNKSISSRNSIDFFPKDCFKDDKLLESIRGLSVEEVKEFYDFKKSSFDIFKKKLLKSYNQKKEKFNNEEIEYYKKEELNIKTNKYIKKYKNELEKAYKKELERLSKFLQYNQISGNEIDKSLLDEYLRHRYWFLESRSDLTYIHKNIEKADIRNLFTKKEDKILNEIDKRLKLANKTQNINLKSKLTEQLSDFIKKDKKYIAFLSGDIFDSFKKVYNEPGHIIHNDKMHISFRNYDKFNIIFPKDFFELVQGYYEENEILKIVFSKDITSEEFNEYCKNNKGDVKPGETLESFVKITVHEKYKLISKNLDDCFRLEVENSETKDEIVYISKNGKKYHRSNCRYLIKKEKKEIPLEEAKEGYAPCSKCNPPE